MLVICTFVLLYLILRQGRRLLRGFAGDYVVML